jgi:NAD(P)-dependent dehydrogenase (short-subunit alcohol dehydrogenase family)
MELMDSTAVITGGTAGIGLEAARLFRRRCHSHRLGP